MKNKLFYLLLFFFCFSIGLTNVYAQNPSLEFFAKATTPTNPTGNGPTVANQVINFQLNSNNPTGNTIGAISAAKSATFVLSNQVQPMTPQPQVGTYFGGTPSVNSFTSPGVEVFPLMSIAGTPANNQFTSTSSSAVGTGIDVAVNRSVYIYMSTNPLHEANRALPTVGNPVRYQYADLTINFSSEVNYPMIHLGGLGSSLGIFVNTDLKYIRFSAEMELISGQTLTKISGNDYFTVVGGTQILNSAPTFDAVTKPTGDVTGISAMSGTVRINAKNISSVTFRIYMKIQDPNTTLNPVWLDPTTTTGQSNSGDGFTVGVSVSESNLGVTKTVSSTTPVVGSNVVFTVTANNPATNSSSDTNVVLQDQLPSGYTYVSHTATNGNGTYIPSTGAWTIGNFANGTTQTLTITATVKNIGSYTNTAVISGDNHDIDLLNNTASVTPVPVNNPIIANDDFGTVVNGATGGNPGINIFTNDVLGTTTGVNPANVILTTGPIPAGIVLNPTTGAVTVNPGTPAGTYTFTYQICEATNPTNCNDAIVTIEVDFCLAGTDQVPLNYKFMKNNK